MCRNGVWQEETLMAEAADSGGAPGHKCGLGAMRSSRGPGRITTRVVAGASGAVLIAFLMGSQAFSQAERTTPASAAVTSVVRNDFGQLKWVATEATDYSPLEKAGRQIYVEARCSYCHAQYSKPRADSENRWSPISDDKRRWGLAVEPGEYAYDNPTQFGSPGIAPDLGRVGLKYGNEWHLAHFYNPPSVVKGSIMGGFSGLFDELAAPVKIVTAEVGKTLEQTPETAKLFDFASKEQVKLTPNEQGVLFVPVSAKGKYPLVWTPNDEYAGDSVKLVGESEKIHALTAYVQKLGTNRGRWRELVEPDHIEGADTDAPRSDEAIAKGKVVYERRCIGCHGAKGDGNGEAAAFMNRQRPRNFTTGVFKFRLTTTGTLPSDRDLLRTISRGVRGTAMPAWYELPLEDRLAVIQYIKYELAADRSDPKKPYFYFVEEPPSAPMEIAAPPKPSPELNSRGKEIWLQAKCWECHGKTGKGDGEKAAGLKDDWSFPIRPADLTTGQFKSGPTVADIFRTISIGLSGSPMPSFQASFPEADRWALSYYILSLSAFTDPLTAAPLPISEADRAALNNLDLQTPGPEQAYKLSRPVKTSNASQPAGAAEKSSALDAAKGKAFSQN
jgi:cytochrome c oxidase cbb3-type subunit I/II